MGPPGAAAASTNMNNTGALFSGMIKYDQVIREDPAVRSSCVRGRGTETSAEDLVGPPWRMESNVGQQQWYGGYPCTPDGGPMGHSARSTVPPPPSASSVDVGRHRGSAWVRQFSPP